MTPSLTSLDAHILFWRIKVYCMVIAYFDLSYVTGLLFVRSLGRISMCLFMIGFYYFYLLRSLV